MMVKCEAPGGQVDLEQGQSQMAVVKLFSPFFFLVSKSDVDFIFLDAELSANWTFVAAQAMDGPC